MEEAQQRKQVKYEDLFETSCSAWYQIELMMIEVGSRGIVVRFMKD